MDYGNIFKHIYITEWKLKMQLFGEKNKQTFLS